MSARASNRTADSGHVPAPARLTARDAASRAGVSERTIRRAIERGELRATKRAGVFQITASDLDRFLVAYRARTGASAASRQGQPRPLPGDDHLRLLTFADHPHSRPAELPRPLTSLVGRDRESQAIGELLRRDEVRLVTMTGPGGTGKTRLALRVANEMAAEFDDGARFVSLIPLAAPELVLPVLLGALGRRDDHTVLSVERLRHLIGDRETLVVIDNFEHLLPAAMIIPALLEAGPRLKILVTSRTLLRLSGEHEFPVPPLTVPDAAAGGEPGGQPETDAVHLFVQRAVAARPDFTLTAGNARAVRAICQRLDGLPLAIELAAARCNYLSPAALLDRLDHPASGRLPLLTGGPRDAPQRHQTMGDAIAWSYDLLDEDEQTLFRHLGVFVGGFTLEAAATVAATDDAAILDGIGSLVAKSLVRFEGEQAGSPRYSLLETIREFSRDRLASHGDEQAVARGRHAAWALAFVEDAGPRAKQQNAGPWLDLLELEHANLRAALAWLAEQGDGPRLLRFAASLWPFWQEHSYYTEGLGWLTLALDLGRNAPAADRLRAMTGAGTMAFYQTELEVAARWHEQALALAREVGDRVTEAFSLINLGAQVTELGDYERARASCLSGLELAREAGETEAMVIATQNLACLAWAERDFEAGLDWSAQTLAVAREHGWDWIVPAALTWYGFLYADLGRYQEAHDTLSEALALGHARGNLSDVINGIEGLARIGFGLGQATSAVRLLGAVSAMRDEAGVTQPPTEAMYFAPILESLKDTLGPAEFAAAWAAGSALSRPQAIAEAMTVQAGPLPAVGPGMDRAGPKLTGREREILNLLVAGASNREISESLFISPATVARHIANIFTKLGVDSRAKATAYALRAGLA